MRTRALELCEALAQHSLVAIDSTGGLPGPGRGCWRPSARSVAERLAARPDAPPRSGAVARRLLPGRWPSRKPTDRCAMAPGGANGPSRLQAEAGNLAAARCAGTWRMTAGRYTHHVPVLYLVPGRSGTSGAEAWSWVRAAAARLWHAGPARPGPSWPGRRRCSPAIDIGDDAAALAARQRLELLLPGIPGSLPARGGPAGDGGGPCRSCRMTTAGRCGRRRPHWRSSAAEDEPVLTAMAALTVGSLETTLGRYDNALRHLREARDLAERVRGDWLAAGSRVQLGILDVVRGSL